MFLKQKWKLFILIISVIYLSSCVSFRGYDNNGRVYARILSDIKEKYIHENKESESGIFYIPVNDCDITSICSENDFYKVIDIVILDFPDFIIFGDNYFTTEIILCNGNGKVLKLRNEYNFSCYGREEYNYSFNRIGFWENFLSTNNIEKISRYSEKNIQHLEEGKVYNFESIYIFKFFQQIWKNHELIYSVNKYFNTNIKWETTNFDNIKMFPIDERPRDSWGYYYLLFTTYNFSYYSYKIVAGKDKDTYLIITNRGEPVAVILDKNKVIRYQNTEQYYSFQEGNYEIDYYQFVKNKNIVCRLTNYTMPVLLTNGSEIDQFVYETDVMDKTSPLYWTDDETYENIWHIKWDDSNWVSCYKYQNQIYNYRKWEEYIIQDKSGGAHINTLTFFNPLTPEDLVRLFH